MHKEILLVYKRWARNLLGVWYWARHRCWWHRWGTMVFGKWMPYVPDWVVGGTPPKEKICGRCGKRKPLRWR